MRDFLYQRLTRALLAELASGLYRERRRFLSYRKVCRLWKVSEPTATTSLAWLVEKGLLSVRRRSGSYVAPESQQKALLLLHQEVSPQLPTPVTWEWKRFQVIPRSGQAVRQIGVILADIQSQTETPSSLPLPLSHPNLEHESVRRLFQEATRQNCSVQFYVDNGQPDRRRVIVEQLLKRRPAGVIAFRRLLSYAPLQPMIAPLVAAPIAVVTVFDDCEGLNVASLNINNIGLGYDVARRFLRLGHRRLAILLPDSPSPYFGDRAVGARMALAEARATDASLEVWKLPFAQPVPVAVARKFRDPRQRPTALFVTNTALFHGLWPLLRRLKLNVPRDVSIIMMAGVTHLAECQRSFDTMRIDFPNLGKLALSALLGLLDGTLKQRTNVLDLRYVRTGSVRRLK